MIERRLEPVTGENRPTTSLETSSTSSSTFSPPPVRPIEEIKISTQTIIASSNCTFDILTLFRIFPIDPSCHEKGVVEVMYYQNEYRGKVCGDFHPRKKRNFRNAINVIAMMDAHKKINFKLSKNGKFQLTGCQNEDQAMIVVRRFVETCLRYCRACVHCPDPTLRISFLTVMTNIDFSLGFAVDRQRLDTLMNKSTPFHSLLETSFGYTGVNIKFPVTIPWWTLDIPVMECDLYAWQGEDGASLVWQYDKRPMDKVETDAQKRYEHQKRYNTFLVFHSGSVIMSGMNKPVMKEHYNLFQTIMRTWKEKIQERLIAT